MRSHLSRALACVALGATLSAGVGCQGEQKSPAPTPTTAPSTAPVDATPPTTIPPPDPHERNAQNFRDDHDYAIAKPAGTTRVVVVGDSMAFGWRVDLKDTLAKQTEQKMNAKGTKTEVLNLSQPAFNALAEIALLKTQGLAYQPDVVVMAYTLDDALSGQETELGDVSQTARLLAGYVVGSLTPDETQKVEQYLKDNRWEKALADAKAAKPSTELYATYFVGHALPLYWEPVQNHLKELAGLAKEAKTKVVVAIIPVMGQPWDGYPFKKLHDQVTKEFQAQGFTVVDFLPTLSQKPAAELTQSGGYPNATAHSMMAERLADALLEDQTPPASPD